MQKYINSNGETQHFIGNVPDGWHVMTKKELKAEHEAELLTSYAESRQNEYPPIGDMIDAICKALDGDITEFNTLNTKRKEIKIKYPKG